MRIKTISGHYGTSYSLTHNNRTFVPHNVDPSRIAYDDFIVSAGAPVPSDFPEILDMNALWRHYRELNRMYWEEYRMEQQLLWEREREIRRRISQIEWSIMRLPEEDTLSALTFILLFPLLLTACVIAEECADIMTEDIRAERFLLKVEKDVYLQRQKSLRECLREHDREKGTKLLEQMDGMVQHSMSLVNRFQATPRFATIEEIYDKVFEPGFREFQYRQRKCRRYEGTYLEQIRERQQHSSKKAGRSEKTRSMNEALEIVFTIGDRDNTGYAAAPDDAHKAECLLRELNRHLLSMPNVCVVTSTELNTPGWQPPFRHGLILLNLTGHFDEETPGVHMTVIPYSRGCKRGPSAQPSLGRALTGMGYPSTWREVLDDEGNPILKKNKNGEIIYNQDGTPRTEKEPDKQGIIDWIEEQKLWLQKEMRERYGWQREYKGSHPRGNLSTPEYKVERARERTAELEQHLNEAIHNFMERTRYLSQTLEQSIEETLEQNPDMAVILNYLRICPDGRFEELLDEALRGTARIPEEERKKVKQQLSKMISDARDRAAQDSVAALANKCDLER